MRLHPALRSRPRMPSRQVNRCTTIASTTHHVLRNILHACGIHVRGSYRGSRARLPHRHLTVGNEVAVPPLQEYISCNRTILACEGYAVHEKLVE